MVLGEDREVFRYYRKWLFTAIQNTAVLKKYKIPKVGWELAVFRYLSQPFERPFKALWRIWKVHNKLVFGTQNIEYWVFSPFSIYVIFDPLPHNLAMLGPKTMLKTSRMSKKSRPSTRKMKFPAQITYCMLNSNHEYINIRAGHLRTFFCRLWTSGLSQPSFGHANKQPANYKIESGSLRPELWILCCGLWNF